MRSSLVERDVPEEIVHLPGLNHLLVKATTGEVSEYGSPKRNRPRGRQHNRRPRAAPASN